MPTLKLRGTLARRRTARIPLSTTEVRRGLYRHRPLSIQIPCWDIAGCIRSLAPAHRWRDIKGSVKLAALGFQVTVFGIIQLLVLEVGVPIAFMARQLHSTVAFTFFTGGTLHVSAAVYNDRLTGQRALRPTL
ncbi:MAG: hypothetical protein AAGA74_19730 [Pseudomonadota bacterium]